MKKLAKLLSTVFLCAAVSGSALAMSSSEMAIGGITPGSSLDYVENIYGAPDKTQSARNNHSIAYWGHGFNMTIRPNGLVNYVTTSANNGLGTPAGLAVGQKIQVMYDLYGTPSHSYNSNGYTNYYYKNHFGDGNSSHFINMEVKEKKGKIAEIICFESYEGPYVPADF